VPVDLLLSVLDALDAAGFEVCLLCAMMNILDPKWMPRTRI
jgi:hypothetical protein